MKRALALFLLLFAAPVLQGALARFLPAAFRPDLALLVVLAVSFCWRNPLTGLLMATACGAVTDLFSGGLHGQHALLSVVSFCAARLLSLHMNMLGTLPQMFFVALLTVGHAIAIAGLTSLFVPGSGAGMLQPAPLALRAAVNALAAPPVTALVALLVAWVGGEVSRRVLRFAPRRWAT